MAATTAENWDLAQQSYRDGNPAKAAEYCRLVLKRKPNSPEALQFLCGLRFLDGRPDEALVLARRAVAVAGKVPENHNNLSAILAALGRHAEALAAADKALALRPAYPQAFSNRGNALRALGRHDEALASYEKALALAPDYLEALGNIAAALIAVERPADAIPYCDRAIALSPTFADAHDTKGNALHLLGRYDEALASLDRAIALRPDSARTLNNRAAVLSVLKRTSEALESCDRAIALQPNFDNALNNRGNALAALGRLDEAADSFRAALAAKPDFPTAHSNLIFCQDFMAGLGFAEHAAERRRWFEAHGRRHAAAIRPHANGRDPDRRLVLGYVSADFRKHSASSCFGPVLRRHDRAAFEVVCYSASSVEDDVTRELRQRADRWRSVVGVPDQRLDEQIREDGVDILVDLSGHSAGNRLTLFARKPAPVQVTGWGHGTGTGLETIDYLLSDPVVIPSEMRGLFAERIYDLPCAITFEAPPDAPPVSARPADAPMTFGCLNRLSKLSPQTYAAWGRVLRALPDARLLLKDPMLQDEQARARLVETFAREGVAAERLELLGGTSHAEHLAAYGRVDIALDPFPQNGGISTFEALWMGVPVVALEGNAIPSRPAAAILTAIGMRDWVAGDAESYVALAVARAGDRAGLATLRARLRDRVAASEAGDPVRYTRAVEAAYRDMWRTYCAG